MIREELMKQMNDPPFQTESERGAYRAGMMAVFQILMQDQKNELTKAWFGMKGGSR